MDFDFVISVHAFAVGLELEVDKLHQCATFFLKAVAIVMVAVVVPATGPVLSAEGPHGVVLGRGVAASGAAGELILFQIIGGVGSTDAVIGAGVGQVISHCRYLALATFKYVSVAQVQLDGLPHIAPVVGHTQFIQLVTSSVVARTLGVVPAN